MKTKSKTACIKPQTVREVLDIIDEFLWSHPDRQNLWDILAALRGPDEGNTDLKLATTALIRGRAFPKTARLSSETGGYVHAAMVTKDTREGFRKTLDWMNVFAHFEQHVLSAFRALGLKFDERNSK